MSGKAAKVVISEKQHAILQRIANAKTAQARLIQRAKIILLAFQGELNTDIAEQVDLSRAHVGKWRRRWKQSWDALIAIECNATTAELRRAIKAVLTDPPRAGAPHQFAAEQVTQVLAIACESPALSQRSIVFWTPREIADEAILRKVVTSISTSHVGRLLQSAMLQPHRCKYWLNTHKNATLVKHVASVEGLDEESLGQKGKSGVLKSMATRQEFQSDTSHQIRFVFLPKHSSWLNQIEVIFGIIARRVLRRGSFKSTDDLKDRLLHFMDYFNTTFAKPFNWTYTGRPVETKNDRRPRTWKGNWVKSRERAHSTAVV